MCYGYISCPLVDEHSRTPVSTNLFTLRYRSVFGTIIRMTENAWNLSEEEAKRYLCDLLDELRAATDMSDVKRVVNAYTQVCTVRHQAAYNLALAQYIND